ncbi:MAG: hypothetical protein CYPHOPRED_003288 [Cyphobasidiales sp. Tagirdzhanova-0007]|nr:MAG: hypothetical protein CYPHOPRED_003288 [Cyphobasidiales sp. Tagirdzhanova-0007]
MVDQDADGLISERDIAKMLQQLGQNNAPTVVSSYFAGVGSNHSINFTTFLTMASGWIHLLFSDHLLTLDLEDELLEAFACFDEQDTGYVPVNKMRGFLASLGNKMSEEDASHFSVILINRFLAPPFTDKHGNFAYRDFLKVLRITDLDQLEKAKAGGNA